MMKFVAKRKLGFRNPETQETVTVEPFAFATVPDWVEKDPMYGWALADGTIEVSGERKPEAETKEPKPAKETKEPKPAKGTKEPKE